MSPGSITRPRQTISWFLLILANLLWACSYVAAKVALRDISVNMMNALRMIIAALVLLPLLISIESIFTAALSWLVLRERFKPLTGAALLLGLLGVYLIIERSLVPNIPAGGGTLRILGDLMVVLALILESLYTVRGKALLVKHSPLLITAVAIVGSTIFWVPLAGGEILYNGWHPLSLTAWLGVGWLAIMSTVIAYLAWFKGLARVDGSAAASTLFVQPLLGTLLAIVLLHDQLLPTTIIGAVMIIASVYLISRH